MCYPCCVHKICNTKDTNRQYTKLHYDKFKAAACSGRKRQPSLGCIFEKGKNVRPVVLYGCETWSLTLRGERKLRVFENMVLRRIFGPRRDEITGEWRRLHNEELNDLYCSPNIVRVIKSRRMRWAGHVARMGEERGVYKVLVRKPEGKRPLGRPRHRWVDNIRMDLQEVGCGYVDWIGLAQDRDRWRKLVSAVMNLRVP